MSRLARGWRALVRGEMDYRTSTFYAITALMAGYSLIYVIGYLTIIRSWAGVFVNGGAFLLYAVSALFIARRHPTVAKVVQFTTLLVHLLAVSYVFSTRAGYHFYYILTPVIAFLSFEFEKTWERIVVISYSVAGVLCFAVAEAFFGQPQFVGISDLVYRILFYMDVALIVLGLFIALRIFKVALKKAEVQLLTISSTDVLTGARNRRYFMEHAEIELARSHRYQNPLAILMLDIDFFKRINDTYGHHEGDKVLRAVVVACQKCIRLTDYFARVGGEEFAVLLVDANKTDTIMVANRIRLTVESLRVKGEGGEIQLTTSIGVAFHSDGEDSLTDLLHRADRQLYAAKDKGRNRVESE